MVNRVIVRTTTFIQDDWVWAYSYTDGAGNSCDVYYKGDGKNRPFTYDTLNQDLWRTAQHIIVDFTNRTVTPYKGVGATTRKVVCTDGTTATEQRTESDTCISYYNETWSTSYVKFTMKVSCGNPFEDLAGKIDYTFDVWVWNTGDVHVEGIHDGFPMYEIHKKVDDNTAVEIYRHDYKVTGEGLSSLYGSGEHTVNVTG